MKRPLKIALRLSASLVLFAATFEGTLRLLPSAVPTNVLLYFEPGLRSRIARGRYSTHDETILLERDDGGPKLRVFKPFTHKVYETEDFGSLKVVTADEIGFCNPPGRYRATPTIDLLAIGDSFTWCHAVDAEQTWALRTGSLAGLSAYNLGHGGQGLYEYLQILKHFGLERSPKAVIMNIYEGNDLRDADEFQRFRDQDTAEDVNQPAAGWRATPVARSSYLYNLLCAGFEYLSEHRALARGKNAIDFRYRVGTAEHGVMFNEVQSDRDEVLYARRLRAGTIDLSIFDEALEAFTALGREHGFAAIVAYSPSAYTAYRDHVTFLDSTLAADLRWLSDAQRPYFAAKAVELGYRFIDLTPHLERAIHGFAPAELLYYPTTLHYSPRGHEVVARALAELLSEIGIGEPLIAGAAEP